RYPVAVGRTDQQVDLQMIHNADRPLAWPTEEQGNVIRFGQTNDIDRRLPYGPSQTGDDLRARPLYQPFKASGEDVVPPLGDPDWLSASATGLRAMMFRAAAVGNDQALSNRSHGISAAAVLGGPGLWIRTPRELTP